MSKADYYDLLGVERGVDDAALKSAYRKLAKQYHPDRNPGDATAEAKFKEVSEAYDVLKDPQRRAAYDRFGHAAFEGGGPGARHGGGQGGFDFADVFDDLFGEFMGQRRGGRGGAARGSDLRYNMEISLEDAYHGTTSEIRIPSTASCEECDGSGAAAGSQPTTCSTCQGIGKVRAQQGFFTIERTCPTCGGRGRVIEKPCRACGGQGRVQREKTLSVKIPAGVDEGNRIRLTGEGEAGLLGGPPGDLYIFISIARHPFFKRDEDNLYCKVPIEMTAAALGGTIEVPTIDGGRASVTIPEGTQNGRQFRLRGKGMPAVRGGGIGDLILQVNVEVPVKLTRRQKELLREFGEAGQGSHSPESEGFFSRVKDLFN
ncbi:molecular chaperone DnaJ [Oceanibacterium hippocampi]|uniref:Chaperone protein DnaJ n=1 Tax=Oceanibacterium hippocampi TaxID=745714 RepID=A0A1Y5RM62_9PROT|nr:molecular chaperone DnaJ [Oceanibacterium hippocampi]SLN18137.1 Chaperone protein DnaJ [Oceanibacterium hippocampi]